MIKARKWIRKARLERMCGHIQRKKYMKSTGLGTQGIKSRGRPSMTDKARCKQLQDSGDGPE